MTCIAIGDPELMDADGYWWMLSYQSDREKDRREKSDTNTDEGTF